MGTFGEIALYSFLMLVGLSAVAALFTFLGIWLSDQAADEDAAH